MNATAHLQITPPEADSAGSELLTIGEVSRLYGVTLRALRFYEQRGLLKPIRRGGARFYDAVQKVRLQMILKGKQLGFTLTEISDLIGAQDTSEDFEQKLQPQQIVTQIDHLERQRRDIEAAITRLRATHARLVTVAPEHRVAS